jgi:hypothetical protein
MRTREVGRPRIINAHLTDRITTHCFRVALRSSVDSQCLDQPAACGRHVCCGIRQSMPSSK